MSQITGTEQPGEGGQIVDLLAFMDPETLDRIEKNARVSAWTTPAGVADQSTGTVRLTKPEQPGDLYENAAGIVVEQLGDEADEQPWRPRRIIPATFTDPAAWRHRRDVALHATAYHLTHSPVYAWRITKVAAYGARYGLADAWGFLTGSDDYGELIAEAKRNATYSRDHVRALRAERRDVARDRRRENTTVITASTATTYVATLVALGQAWSWALLAPALLPLVVVLYLYGHRELVRRNPVPPVIITSPFTDSDSRPPLTDALLNRVLRTAKVIKEDQEITLTQPIRPAEIAGTEARFKLPDDVQFSQVLAKREAIAGALDVETHWLDIQQDGSPSRVSFWYTDRDPFGEPRTSPLVAHPERTDVWNVGILIGFNRRGLPIYLKLRHVMALLGGMSRTGKGMLLRNLICGLGLDPRVNLRLVAGAKPGEHRGYGPICATFFGRRPERLVVLLDALLAEAYRREAYLEDIGRAKLSEKDLDRFPLEILIIDEYKQYANSTVRVPDPRDPEKSVKACDRIAEQLEDLAAFAAALNITVLVSTQDPDANTIPRGFKSNSGARVATRTGGSVQTNAILKDGATGAGLRAHDIPESLKGGAIVDIDGAPGELIRSYFIEDEKFDGAEDIIEAGRALREALGRAPGQFEDPIEAYLIARTGASSIGGGPAGSGRPGAPEGPGGTFAVLGILDLLIGAFPLDDDGQPADRVPMVDVREHLAEYDPQTWGPQEEETQAAYEARFGKRLAAELEGALQGTGVELAAKSGIRFGKDAGGREIKGSGFYLKDVQAALTVARNAHK